MNRRCIDIEDPDDDQEPPKRIPEYPPYDDDCWMPDPEDHPVPNPTYKEVVATFEVPALNLDDEIVPKRQLVRQVFPPQYKEGTDNDAHSMRTVTKYEPTIGRRPVRDFALRIEEGDKEWSDGVKKTWKDIMDTKVKVTENPRQTADNIRYAVTLGVTEHVRSAFKLDKFKESEKEYKAIMKAFARSQIRNIVSTNMKELLASRRIGDSLRDTRNAFEENYLIYENLIRDSLRVARNMERELPTSPPEKIPYIKVMIKTLRNISESSSDMLKALKEYRSVFDEFIFNQ